VRRLLRATTLVELCTVKVRGHGSEPCKRNDQGGIGSTALSLLHGVWNRFDGALERGGNERSGRN
jgi:hypothetical protein